MSVLEKIAYYQNRRDEVPTQQLAAELAETENKAGIKKLLLTSLIRTRVCKVTA